MRRAVAALLLVATTLTGCADPQPPDAGGGAASSSPTPDTGSPAAAPAPDLATSAETTIGARGTFAGYTAGAPAITYDPALVPAGATAELSTAPAGDGVTVRLQTTGLNPGRRYGAHLHTSPCGASADQAGPHYQHRPDPAAVASPPSVDPGYANPGNEVWLDFTTDAAGAGTGTATQPWPFDAINPPRSLVIHADATATEPGRAGTAGPRVACLTLPD